MTGWLSRLFGRASSTVKQPEPAMRPSPVTSPESIAKVLRALGAQTSPWASILSIETEAAGIDTPRRLAAFLANICHETGGLSVLRENLNYAADRLIPVFGAHRFTPAQAASYGRIDRKNAHLYPGRPLQPANQEAIAMIAYGGEWGQKNLGNRPGTVDAWTFIGRGLIQLTGRSNYERFAKTIGVDVDALPTMLEQPQSAAASAAVFWVNSGCNELADAGDIAAVRKRVNGGSIGLAEVRALYSRALGVLGT